MLTPPYGNRNCTYYREVFPPQWIDGQGRPTIVPSEEVASWVAWQQAGRQHDVNNGAAAAGAGNGAGQSSKYPGVHGMREVEGVGGEEVIVGLEVWKEPSDFHVARGLYTGQRVACDSSS